MSALVFAALLFASAARQEPPVPEPLALLNGATGHGTPFEAKCFSRRQTRRLEAIDGRLGAAEKILAARYGQEAVENAVAIIMEGSVKRFAPCDRVKQDAYLDRYDTSVAALEAELKAK
jgi:hypothetical protein